MKFAALLLITLAFTVHAENPITQIDCGHQYLPEVGTGGDDIYQFANYTCTQGDQRSQLEIKNYPSKNFKKFKQLGKKRVGTIYQNGVAVESEYSESETIYTSANYYIPTCQNYQGRWRMQVAAISDPIQSANEVFYNKIEELVESCQIPTQEMEGWNFCKTYGEEFGAYENSGTNKTTRLYLQLNSHQMDLGSVAPRDSLLSSCQQNVETALWSRFQGCVKTKSLDDAKALVVPPIAFINKYFNVSNHKLQFVSCENLATSSHLELKP